MTNNIIISGLTAAGKTTHSKLITEIFNMSYKSASTYLLEYFGIHSPVPSDFWISNEAHNLENRRKNDTNIDIWVNQRLIDDTLNLEKTIFDSWSLPWVSKESALRIWLESSLQTRVWKASISAPSSSHKNLGYIRKEVRKKDNFTRNLFFELYDFDLFKDHKVFDYIIDISRFLSEPTSEASKVSIAKSQEIMSAIVAYYIAQTPTNMTQLAYLIKKYGTRVFLKVPDYFAL